LQGFWVKKLFKNYIYLRSFAPQKHSRSAPVMMSANHIAFYPLAVPESCFPLGARASFDRGASLRSLKCCAGLKPFAHQKHSRSAPVMVSAKHIAFCPLAVPESCFPLGARAPFDRGASLRSLLPPPAALATSPGTLLVPR